MEPAAGLLGHWEGLLQQQQPTRRLHPGEPILQVQGIGWWLLWVCGCGLLNLNIKRLSFVCLFPRRWATVVSQWVRTRMASWSCFLIEKNLMCELCSSSWWSPSTSSWEATRLSLSMWTSSKPCPMTSTSVSTAAPTVPSLLSEEIFSVAEIV